MPYEWILTIVTAAVCVILVVVLFFIVRDKNFGKKPERQHKRISGALRQFAGIRGFKVLDDFTVEANGKTAHADHLLIGFFGILVVQDLTSRGDYYGDIKDKNWVHIQSGRRTVVPNYANETQECIVLSRVHLSQKEIYNVPVQDVIVVADRQKKTSAGLSKTPNILYFKEFKKYLRKVMFEKDNNIDVPKMYALFEEIRKK